MKCTFLPATKFLVLALFGLPFGVQAQEERIPASQAYLYEIRHEIYDDRFYREHEPLDGATAGAIPFRQDSLYGFVDKRTKEWILKPRFTQVYAVYAEGAIVEEKEGPYSGRHAYGLVDFSGKYLIGPHFEELFKEGELYHGLASKADPKIERNHNSFIYHVYYSKTGMPLLTLKSHDWATFLPEDSIGWSRYGPEYTIFGRSGSVLKKFSVTEERVFIGIFRNTLVFAENPRTETQTYAGYNAKGKKLWSLRLNEQVTAVVQMSTNAFGVLSEDGFFILDAQSNVADWSIQNGSVGFGFENMFPQLNALDLVPVRHFETQKWGYINKQGKLVIPCKYHYAGIFYKGKAPVLEERVFFPEDKRGLGFIDASGKTVVPFVIPASQVAKMVEGQEPPRFSEGLCAMQVAIPTIDAQGRAVYDSDEDGGNRSRFAYYDLAGKRQLLLPDSFFFAGAFAGGRAPVVVGEARGLGFIDTTGKLVIAAKYEVAMAGACPFPQLVIPEFKGGFAYLKGWKGYVGVDGYEYFSGKRVEDEYDFSH